MRKFLHCRLLRCIVCFCLICCVFVNCSPIRAKAVIPESILIEAGIIVGSILLGLGVGMGADSTQDVFTGLVNDCVDVIKSDYDFIDEEGLATAYVSASVDESRSYYYAAKELVEAVRTWLFESETITVLEEPEFSSREALIKSARAVSERFCLKLKFGNRRNTGCISRFQN